MKSNKVNWEKYKSNITGDSKVTFGDGHVGGCNINGDPATELPKTWKHIVDQLNIKSVIDVGCGFGFHTKYFKEQLGCKVLGIEGSSKVVELSLLPNEIIHHDYTAGPFVPNEVFDLCWTIEFVEHVSEKYVQNFIDTFKQCKYLAMTHGLPGQGGYHHVNCQPAKYWIDILRRNGFSLMADFTESCRSLSYEDLNDYIAWRADPNPNKPYRGPAAQQNDSRKNDNLEPFFAKNGLIFKNENLF
jgi:SAM-dependent methyltransferase